MAMMAAEWHDFRKWNLFWPFWFIYAINLKYIVW